MTFNKFRWLAAVLSTRALGNAAKTVAGALMVASSDEGNASVGIPQLAAATVMSERWVKAAMADLLDAKAIERKRHGRRGRHTALYVLSTDYGHSGAPSRPDKRHSGAPSRGEYGHSGAPNPVDAGEVTPDNGHSGAPNPSEYGHSSAPSRSDKGHSGAPFLKGGRELREGRVVVDEAREVDEDDVARVVAGLPDDLAPQVGQVAELLLMAEKVRQRLRRGWDPDRIVQFAGLARSKSPINDRISVFCKRVPLDPPPHVVDLRLRRKEDQPWCGECDRESRRPLDENGYVDTTQPRDSCPECHALRFAAHVAVP